MLKHYDDSKRFLLEHPDLVCEDTANYLVVWCIDLEIEEVIFQNLNRRQKFVNLFYKFLKKRDLMEHVAHQCIVMQFILELSKTLKYDPRVCVDPFFSKMQMANKEYKEGFYEELNAFKDRIRRRAQEKIEAAMKEVEEEERSKRLGPGGLDPIEVFESLPEELQKCFESQDIGLLQETLLKMKREDAEYHMDRCVKSGLWVPDAKQKAEQEERRAQNEAGEAVAATSATTSSKISSEEGEDHYESVD
jgi:cell division cycle protein 37